MDFPSLNPKQGLIKKEMRKGARKRRNAQAFQKAAENRKNNNNNNQTTGKGIKGKKKEAWNGSEVVGNKNY